MSNYAAAFALNSRVLLPEIKRVTRKRSFKVELIELLRPDGYWPQPLSVEQAFETMRWMVETGHDPKYVSGQRWGNVGVLDLLSATSGIGHSCMIPVTGLDDLRKRFHYAVLGRLSSEGQARWREDFGIGPAGVINVKRPVYRPFDGAPHFGWRSEGDIVKALSTLCDKPNGKRMAVSLNSIHKQTVNWLHGVVIRITKYGGFYFELRYGNDPTERGYSQWDATIAHSRDGETFLDTMARARDVYECLVNGVANGADTGDMRDGFGADYVTDQIKALGDEKVLA